MTSKLSARAPGLDLARALAISAVLACHLLVILPTSSLRLQVLLSYTGEVGVNLFFALSGFLIGRIALQRVDTLRDAAHFWTRRWFRTLPAGLVVAGLLGLVLHPSVLNFLATITFTRGLFRDAGQSPFLPHYWSLMIEEWFYLLLPFLLLAVGRGRHRLACLVLAWVCLALLHVPAATVLHLTYSQQAFLTWMRLDAILAGVVVAGAEHLFQGAVGRFWCEAGWCGIAALFAMLLLADPVPVYDPLLLMVAPRGMGDFVHAAQLSLVPVLFAVTLPAMAAWRPARPHGAEWRIVQIIALLTYALYLVHWDIYRFMANLSGTAGLNAVAACVLAVALSLLLAWLVHVAVERPFMALRDRVAPDAPVPVPAQASATRFLAHE